MSKLTLALIFATILMAVAVVAMALALSFNLKQHEDIKQLTETVTAAVNNRTVSTTQSSEVSNRAVPVSFFVAQNEEGEDLTKLTIDDMDLWAQSQPALTQADLSSVAPTETEAGQPFLFFGFSDEGREKLTRITEASHGKTIVVAVDGAVMGTIAIEDTVDNGRLGITTSSKQMAEQIAQAIVNGVPAQQ